MEKSFDVTFENKKFGTATLRKEGLYYAFSCRCKLPDQLAYRIIINCEGKKTNLGICVPKEDLFGLDTKHPIKKVGEGPMTFTLVSITDSFEGRFVPVFENQPVDFLGKLSEARMEMQNGQEGIIFPS